MYAYSRSAVRQKTSDEPFLLSSFFTALHLPPIRFTSNEPTQPTFMLQSTSSPHSHLGAACTTSMSSPNRGQHSHGMVDVRIPDIAVWDVAHMHTQNTRTLLLLRMHSCKNTTAHVQLRMPNDMPNPDWSDFRCPFLVHCVRIAC